MKRIQRGAVRGISLKVQEEERERRMDFVPEVSVLDQERIDVDVDTHKMLQSIDFPDIQGVHVQDSSEKPAPYKRRGRGARGGRGGRGRGGRGRGGRTAKAAPASAPAEAKSNE